MKVYCIENKLDGRKYVGITRGEIGRRFKQHKTITKTKNGSNKSHIHNAMALYGVENFKVYELDNAETKEELFEKEKHWIKTLDTKNNGYNETDGGEGTFGWKATDEQRKQNSERIKKIMENKSHRQLLSEKTKNYWNSLSEEERDKKRKQFNKTKIGNQYAKGKHWNLSDETKNKMSKSKTGIPKSEEYKKQMSISRQGKLNPNYGRKHSPETIEKMKQSALKRKIIT
jgi:group I intron endonuclease